MASVELRGIAKLFPGGVEAVAPTDLAVGDGELFVIVGPSGSGKSTMLRLIAGLETPSAGSLWIDGQRADGLAPADRDVALVFQNLAVYPYLTVFDNLAFGLRARGLPRAEVRERVTEVAARLGLSDLLGRSPKTLSGGERQRVALGRAIARRPRLFLFDEPFSSLDAPLRAALRAELLDLHRRLNTTMIHVTHDQAEAMALGDRIAVMDQGRVVQAGPPQEVYDRPASRFVAEFLGSPPMSLWPCEIGRNEEALRVRMAGSNWRTAWVLPEGEQWVGPLRERGPGRVDLGVRPEQLELFDRSERPALPPAPAHWEAVVQVRRLEPLGHETLAALALGPHQLHARLSSRTRFRVGDRGLVRFDPSRASWFDAETGTALESEEDEQRRTRRPQKENR